MKLFKMLAFFGIVLTACLAIGCRDAGEDCEDEDGDNWYASCDDLGDLDGPDADDNNPNVWNEGSDCVDGDTDGYYTDCDAYDTVDQDMDDADPNNWTAGGVAGCVDADIDGYWVGCDAYTTISFDADDLDNTVH